MKITRFCRQLTLLVLPILLISSTISHSALKPRWTPPKPGNIVQINPEHFNRDCITIKFVEGSDVRLRNGALVSLSGQSLSGFEKVIGSYDVRFIKRSFSRPEHELELSRERGQMRSGKQLADLNLYYRVILDPAEEPERFIEDLHKLDIIEIAFANPIPVPADDIDPETDDFSADQGYLYDAPEGIDAPAAWEVEGGTGENVKIIDIEGGWNFDHEDFKEEFYLSMDNAAWDDHGDAVVGIMIGQHNGYGIDGICPDAEIGGHSVYDDMGDWPNVADAFDLVADELDEGDIFLVELHAVYGNNYAPMETWQDNFDALETASANGIIPVEAAGNGNQDLDDEDIFDDRFDPEERHSGAILVGAGNPPVGNWGEDRSRCSFSNYGERVDVQGWGREVVTAGYGDLFYPNNDKRQWYTEQFGGTSSATPIVAGAIACLQGIYKNRTNGRLTLDHEAVREILIETGSAQNIDDDDGHIGPRPNLEDAIELIPYFPAWVTGTVTEEATGDPVENARVGEFIINEFGFVARGFEVFTDENGDFTIELMSEVEYTLLASKIGYVADTSDVIWLEEDDTLEVNFALTSSLFAPSDTTFEAILNPNDTTYFEFSVENEGDGILLWDVEKRLPDNADVEPYEFRESFHVADSVDNNRLYGAAFAEGEFYVTGRRSQDGEYHKIYVFSKDGEYLRAFNQPDTSDNNGIRDLAWDSQNQLLWGGVQQTVYGFTTEGEVEYSFEVDLGGSARIQSIAWENENELVCVAGLVTDLYRYSVDGEQMDSFEMDRLRLYGIGNWDEAPDGYNLLIMHQQVNSAPEIHRLNTDTGEMMLDATLLHPDSIDNSGGGIEVTSQYDVYSSVIVHLVDDGDHDRIDIWQLDSRKDWFELYLDGEEASSGVIEAGNTTDFEIMLTSTGLPGETMFNGLFSFYHNAPGMQTDISVEMFVAGGPPPPPSFGLLTPEDQTSINPYDSTDVIFSWEEAFNGDQDWFGLWFQYGDETAGGAYLNDAEIDMALVAGAFGIDPFEQDAEIAFEWWVTAHFGRDTVYSEDRFTLILAPNDVTNEDNLPFEFGLRSVYPNPFNATTTIEFGMDRVAEVEVSIFDLQGREVRRIQNGKLAPGVQTMNWQAKGLPSGLYLLRLESDGRVEMQKIALVR